MDVIRVENLGIKFDLKYSGKKKLKDKILRPFAQDSEIKELWALRNVSFAIEKGDIVAIIGRNGAGKSTLLRVLAGIFPPDEGSVKVIGKVSPLLSLGAGFQSDLTGRDNIYINGVFLGLTEEEINGRYESIVEFSGLRRFIDTPVRNYSSGMLARLSFSVAVCIAPDILLIDEILGVGDRGFRQKSKQRMREFMDKAEAIVIATHNTEFVNEFCNKAIWIDNGEMRSQGLQNMVVNEYIEAYG